MDAISDILFQDDGFIAPKKNSAMSRPQKPDIDTAVEAAMLQEMTLDALRSQRIRSL